MPPPLFAEGEVECVREGHGWHHWVAGELLPCLGGGAAPPSPKRGRRATKNPSCG